MDKGLILRRFREGFRRSVSGASPLSLVGSKGFPMSRNVISGNSKRTIKIDGVEYVVPDGITLLESIDNNGSAWFDLGMPIGSSDVITFDIAWNALVNSPFFGAYNSGGSYNRNSFNGTYISNGSKKGFYDNALSISYFEPTIGVRATLKWNGLNVKPTYDGVEFGATPINDITPSVNAYLGTRKQGGTAGSVDDITLYGFKVERNNNVVMLLFGAKNASNVVGVYDFIRGIFIAPQGGTCTAGAELPTPEHPLGVYGVGDKTENLFNPDDANTRYPNGWYPNGGVIADAPNANRTIILPCSTGDVFTFKHYTEASGARYFWIYSDTVAVGEPCSSAYGDVIGTGPKTTTAAPSNAKYIGICFWRINAGTIQSAADDFVVVKGSTAPTTYIPYGYKVDELLAQNCGMVDLGTLNWSYRGDLQSGVFMCTSLTNKKAGLTNLYTSEYDVTNETSSTRMADMEIIGNITSAMFYIRETRYTDAATFKAAMSGKYLYYQRTTDSEWITPSKVTTYIDKPLDKVGTYADTFDMATGEHTENGSEITFDGSDDEAWSDASSGDKHIYYTPIQDRLTIGNYKYGFCSHFGFSTATSGNVPDLSMFYYGSLNTGFRYDTITSVADWRAFLAANPITVKYPKATPTTSQHSPVQITLPKGAVIIESTNEVKASNISATYKSQTNQ